MGRGLLGVALDAVPWGYLDHAARQVLQYPPSMGLIPRLRWPTLLKSLSHAMFRAGPW